MSFLRKKFKLGSLDLENNIFYAPLAGCSDYPFRQMTSVYRPGLFYCEMVKMEALVRNDPTTFHLLDFDKSMHPIAGQIVGANSKIAGEAARIIEDLGFSVVDLNCGCPVDKVTKDGGGSGLIKTPEKIGEILSAMVSSVSIPVTVKIRAGWSDNNIKAAEITKIAEDAGAKLITIHGRTREQAYRGPANWDYVKEAKQAAKNIYVFGNGDVVDGESARRCFEETSCDGVLVARGTLGQPWVVEDISRYLQGLCPIERTEQDYLDALLMHFSHSLDYYTEKKAVTDMRRLACWYFKKDCRSKEFRKAISKVESKREVHQVIHRFWGS